MKTIIYQGQEVQVQVVNSICGDGITTSTPKEFTGEEELLRDEAGHYYRRQCIDWIDPVGDHLRDDLIKASGRTRVHRINLNAAILWATTRLNSVTLDLRADAAELLTEGRGYTDPAPTPKMRQSVELAAKANEAAAPLAQDPEADTVTVPVTLPRDLYRLILAMGEYDGRASFSETVQCSMDGEVVAWLHGPDKPAPSTFLARWLAEHPLKQIAANQEAAR